MITGKQLRDAVISGANSILKNRKFVDDLNIFRRAHTDGIPNVNGVVVDFGCRSAFFRRHAGNGQNGAFGRLHDG